MTDTNGTTTVDSMPTTTVSKSSAGIQTPVPPELVDALGLADLDADHRQVAVRIRCQDGGPVLDLAIGAVDGQFPTRTASVKGGRYCYLSLPRFVAEAWRLEGVELQWPDADAIETIGPGETVALQVGIDGWTSSVAIDDTGEFGHESTVSLTEVDRSGRTELQYTTTVPVAVARELGVFDGGEVAVRAACFESRPIAVLDPDGGEATVTVTAPTGSNSPRVVGQSLPYALGLLDRIHDAGRVRLEWSLIDDKVVTSLCR